jgi:hypothetical protein
LYSQGRGAAKNNEEAFKWMLKSAELGYARAQNNIGLYYKNGTGTKIDLEAAVMWLEKAEATNYDKLARKALKEARRLLAQQKTVCCTTPPLVPDSPLQFTQQRNELVNRQQRQQEASEVQASSDGGPEVAVGGMSVRERCHLRFRSDRKVQSGPFGCTGRREH